MFVVGVFFLMLKGPTEAEELRANESHNAASLVGLLQRLTQLFSGRIFFFIFILQTKKLKLKQVEKLSQSHSASSCYSC